MGHLSRDRRSRRFSRSHHTDPRTDMCRPLNNAKEKTI
jgi:hypothetical protein